MLRSSTILKYARGLILPCLVFAFAVHPLDVHAQKKKRKKKQEQVKRENDTPAESSSKKSTRIFYGQASFYSNKFNGRRTASGETFNQEKYTCACNVLPIGTWVKVTNLKNGLWAYVKINDRIHPKMNRIVDLSRVAAQKLGYVSIGLTRVKVEVMGKKKPK